MTVRLPLKGSVLEWARTTAGYSQSQAAEKLGIPTDRLAAWEGEGESPTLTLARKMAAAYKRPLATLFFEIPPNEPPDPPDFRTIQSHEISLGSETRFVIRHVRYWQDLASDLAEEQSEAVSLDVPEASIRHNPEDVATKLREWSRITVRSQRSWGTANDAFNMWRAAVESHKVLVFVQVLPREECRGFSLWDLGKLPAMVINSKEVPQARAFTLLHELAHLALRQAGICDQVEGQNGHRPVEAFCNRVAGAMLIPPELIMQAIGRAERSRQTNPEALVDILRRAAHSSRHAAAIRLESVGAIPRGSYETLKQEWLEEEWRPRGEGGPIPPHRRVLSERGRLFTGLVLQAWRRGNVGSLEAAEMLETKAPTLAALAAVIG